MPHHLSRQTCGLSITYNIYKGECTLFEPAVHNYISDHLTSGRSAAEFPGLYWCVAMLWRLTGPSEFSYRLLMLALHFMATCAMFLGLRKLLGNGLWAGLVALLMFASPVMAYFTIAFMPDVPAFDLAILGCWFMFREYPHQPARDVIAGGVLFALGGLLKVTALMAPLALMITVLVGLVLPKNRRIQGLFPSKGIVLGTMVAALMVVGAWYNYSISYNGVHGGNYTYQGTWAIWDLSPAEVCGAWKAGRTILVYQIFDTPVWLLFIGAAGYVIWRFRDVPATLGLITVTLFLGTVVYVLLWWVTLDSHDYYYINPMVTLIALLATFLYTLKHAHPRIFRSTWSLGAFGLLLCYSVVYAANNHEMRTRGDTPLRAWRLLPLYHEHELAYWDLIQHWDLKHILDIEAYNRSIGIKEEDLVICPDDLSVCGSLYLMHQRGWQRYGQAFATSAEMDTLIARGAAYLFTTKREWLEAPQLQPYLKHPVGLYYNVHIFDIRPPKATGPGGAL